MGTEDAAARGANGRSKSANAAEAPGTPGLARTTLRTACVVLLAALFAPRLLGRAPSLPTAFLAQDVVGLTVLGLIQLFLGLAPALPVFGAWSRLAAQPRWASLALAVAVAVTAWIGTWLVCHGFALSYDEVMAEFDARIFGSGALIGPIPVEWRAYRQALAPHFLLPVPGNDAWVSAYLPMNAMLRALFAAIGSPALTGPVLLGIAVLMVAAVALRLWPGRPDAALVAVLLLVTSPQALATAMTPYAMTGHLTLDLAWLWLFLRGGRAGHGGAAAVGFVACGLHQVVFHPLFVAPFLIGLVLGRSWRLVAFYTAAYGAIGAFWTLYWPGVLAVTGFGGGAGHGAEVGASYQIARIAALLAAFDWNGLDLMAKNLIRFVTWQSPLLVPLLILSWPALRRGEGPSRALAGGIVLTTLAMFVLLPYQGHGWGYRYLHGLIGSACLLAAQGWITATRTLSPPRRVSANALFGLGCTAALALLALRAVQVERFVSPYAAAWAAIHGLATDIVLIDDRDLAFGSDLVRNDPFLTDRPILVLRRGIASEADLRALCSRGSVGVFGAAEAERLGLPITDPEPGRPPTPNPCATGRENGPG